MMDYNNDPYSSEAGLNTGFDFSEKSVRHSFIRKVYGILTVQLLVTLGFVGAFTTESAKVFARQNQWLFWVAFGMTLVCILALACCGNLRRKTPHNFIFLGVFTICEGFLLGIVTARYEVIEVLMAVGITFAVVAALTLFAFQTKYDFTMCGGFVVVSVVVFMIFGILAMIFRNRILSIVYASVGALLFSFYLVFDTQMMIGGNHKYSVSPEEYIFAALNLYLDIVNIFIYILTLIGAARD